MVFKVWLVLFSYKNESSHIAVDVNFTRVYATPLAIVNESSTTELTADTELTPCYLFWWKYL